MEVTILGSGTAVPVADRFPSGVLVVIGSQVIVVDMGPGVLRRLAQAGYGPDQITTVLITHFHTDHTADLAALLFALRNPKLATRPPLTILGPHGLIGLIEGLTAVWPWLRPKNYSLEVREIEPGTYPLGSAELTAVSIEHTPVSLAYRISDEHGTSVALSGDADVCEGLAEVARRADLFICEAAFPDQERTAGHLTPSLAGAGDEDAQAEVLCLTHFYPECEGHDLRAQAESTYSGEVVLAEDLMRFVLEPDRKGP